MQLLRPLFSLCLVLVSLCFSTGCRRNSNVVWEDTKSAGRYMNRGIRSLGGKHGESRQVRNRHDFIGGDGMPYPPYIEEEFEPLIDDPNSCDLLVENMVSRPPRESPGEPGSTIPGIESFKDPAVHPQWRAIFHTIYFAYNSSLIKGESHLATIRAIADYMRQHPRLYIFIEGHCDERGPAAYNLALGSYRANAVRNVLINEGVNPDNLFTISYGCERPVDLNHEEESWSKNRRAEFKLYER